MLLLEKFLMIKFKRRGSFMLGNLFFVVIVFTLAISLLRFQSSNLKNMNSMLISKSFFDQLDVIKNELYFNKQYPYLGKGIYINPQNISTQNYKEFKEIFENEYTGIER